MTTKYDPVKIAQTIVYRLNQCTLRSTYGYWFVNNRKILLRQYSLAHDLDIIRIAEITEDNELVLPSFNDLEHYLGEHFNIDQIQFMSSNKSGIFYQIVDSEKKESELRFRIHR